MKQPDSTKITVESKDERTITFHMPLGINDVLELARELEGAADDGYRLIHYCPLTSGSQRDPQYTAARLFFKR